MADSRPPGGHDVFVAIGDGQLNRIRARPIAWARVKGYALASYISSRAFVWHNVGIGENAFIPECNVLPFTTIGAGVTLWSGNHIGHRTVIDDYVFVAPHVVVSGYCRLEAHSFLGVNASVAHRVEVAADNFIATCAVVTKSTQPEAVYQGAPAVAHGVAATRFCRVKA